MMMGALLWTLFVVGVAVGFGVGYSGGYVRGLHVGHVRGGREALEFEARYRELVKKHYAPQQP